MLEATISSNVHITDSLWEVPTDGQRIPGTNGQRRGKRFHIRHEDMGCSL